MKNKQVLVIIPAYNEATTIGEVVRSVKHFADQVVVIDDCSSDSTASLAKSAGAKVISHPINLGQGAALQTGFDYAKTLTNIPAVTITFDADGQFLASEIPKLVQPILDGNYDVILGSRFLGQVKNIALTRKLLLKIGVIFTKVFSNLNLTDTHNGFRALSATALTKIDLKQNRMAHASEILDQISLYRLKYQEVPVTVLYTDYSKSKGQNGLNSLKIVLDLVLSRMS